MLGVEQDAVEYFERSRIKNDWKSAGAKQDAVKYFERGRIKNDWKSVGAIGQVLGMEGLGIASFVIQYIIFDLNRTASSCALVKRVVKIGPNESFLSLVAKMGGSCCSPPHVAQ